MYSEACWYEPHIHANNVISMQYGLLVSLYTRDVAMQSVVASLQSVT